MCMSAQAHTHAHTHTQIMCTTHTHTYTHKHIQEAGVLKHEVHSLQDQLFAQVRETPITRNLLSPRFYKFCFQSGQVSLKLLAITVVVAVCCKDIASLYVLLAYTQIHPHTHSTAQELAPHRDKNISQETLIL